MHFNRYRSYSIWQNLPPVTDRQAAERVISFTLVAANPSVMHTGPGRLIGSRIMNRINYNMKEHGFVGHLSVPEQNTKHGVIVIMGGEQSLLPGTLIADRFADYGIAALAVSLFGAEGLPEGADQIPLDMFIPAIKVLKDMGCTDISSYGMSMGSIFAALIPKYIGGIDNVILCSPTHVPFEGSADKKTNSGRSVATWKGQDIPFVRPRFSLRKMTKYYYDAEADRKVTGMWIAYRDAYRDKALEEQADLKLYETKARILLIAGTGDEAWPSDYSVNYIKNRLDAVNYEREYKVCIYPNASHLIGMMPNKERERRLYRMLPLIGFMYKTFGKHKKECMHALEESEREIVNWILDP